MTSSLAASPPTAPAPLPPPRRWLQFRLRTLMLAMLVLPIGLGWLAQERSKSQKAWANVEAIEADYRGSFFGIHRPFNPLWERTLGIDLPRIDDELYLSLRETDNKESQIAALKRVANIPNLKRLEISSPLCTAEALEPLSQSPDLVELYVCFVKDSDEPISLPFLPRLKRLQVDDFKDLPDLEIFSAVPALESLAISVVPLDLERTHGLRALKKLKRLRIRLCPKGSAYPKVDDEGRIINEGRFSNSNIPFWSELGTLSELEELELDVVTESNLGLKPIANLKKLKRLAIHGPVTDSELATLCEFTWIERIEIYQQELSAETAAQLKQMKNLRVLELLFVCLVQEMEMIAEIPQLEKLVTDIYEPPVEIIEPLTRNPKLKSLSIGGKVPSDPEAVEMVSKISTLEHLELKEHNGWSNRGPSDEMLKSLTRLRKLRYLNLDTCPKITNAGLTTLATIPTLKELWFQEAQVTGAEVDQIIATRPDLEVELGCPYLQLDNWW